MGIETSSTIAPKDSNKEAAALTFVLTSSSAFSCIKPSLTIAIFIPFRPSLPLRASV